jgi:structural maintenance of chromosome 2
VDARAWLAQATGDEEQKLDMKQRDPGELDKRWKAVEQEAGQGENDIKKMQAEVENLRKKADRMGWSAEK